MTTTFFCFLGFIILLTVGGYTVTRKWDYTPKTALMKKSSDINELTKKVSEIVNNASYLVLFGDTAMSADTKDIYLEAVAKVFSKQITGANFIAGLKSALQ